MLYIREYIYIHIFIYIYIHICIHIYIYLKNPWFGITYQDPQYGIRNAKPICEVNYPYLLKNCTQILELDLQESEIIFQHLVFAAPVLSMLSPNFCHGTDLNFFQDSWYEIRGLMKSGDFIRGDRTRDSTVTGVQQEPRDFANRNPGISISRILGLGSHAKIPVCDSKHASVSQKERTSISQRLRKYFDHSLVWALRTVTISCARQSTHSQAATSIVTISYNIIRSPPVKGWLPNLLFARFSTQSNFFWVKQKDYCHWHKACNGNSPPCHLTHTLPTATIFPLIKASRLNWNALYSIQLVDVWIRTPLLERLFIYTDLFLTWFRGVPPHSHSFSYFSLQLFLWRLGWARVILERLLHRTATHCNTLLVSCSTRVTIINWVLENRHKLTHGHLWIYNFHNL